MMRLREKLLSAAVAAVVAVAPVAQASGAEHVGATSWKVKTATVEALKAAVEAKASDEAEGVWRMTEDGTVVGIVEGAVAGGKQRGGGAEGALTREADRTLLIVVLKSGRASVEAGTVVGWMRPTAKPGYYQGKMFTRCYAGEFSRPKPFTLHKADANHLTMKEQKNGWRFLPWRMLPWMFRRAVQKVDTRDQGMEGMVRVGSDVRYL